MFEKSVWVSSLQYIQYELFLCNCYLNFCSKEICIQCFWKIGQLVKHPRGRNFMKNHLHYGHLSFTFNIDSEHNSWLLLYFWRILDFKCLLICSKIRENRSFYFQLAGFSSGWRGGRKFATDMAGFCVNLKLIKEVNATFPPMSIRVSFFVYSTSFLKNTL